MVFLTQVLGVLTIVVQFILALSLLVLIHELGHFMWARIFGVRVDKFFLFFDVGGKALFRWTSPKSHTMYGIGWLPLGGYCKIGGMVDESMDTKQFEKPSAKDEFRNRPAWQRLLIMSGGVINNFLLAFLIFTSIALYWGKPYLASKDISRGMSFSTLGEEVGFRNGDVILSVDGKELNASDAQFVRQVIEAKSVTVRRQDSLLTIPIPKDMMQRVLRSGEGLLAMQVPFVVDSVIPQSLAEKSGLQKGDRVDSVNGVATPDVSDVRLELSLHKNDSIVMVVCSAQDTYRTLSFVNDSTGRIGVQLKSLDDLYPTQIIRYSLDQAIGAGWNRGTHIFVGQAQDMKYVFSKEGVNQMGGLISIARLFPAVFSWYWFWEVCAFLSVIFAFMNLLPIPALDGGHILFTLWEMVTRRKLPESVLMRFQMAGMLLVLLLILYVNVKDIFRLF